jgi:hypothetical protein
MRDIFIDLRKTRGSETCTRKEELSKGQNNLQWKETNSLVLESSCEQPAWPPGPVLIAGAAPKF